MLYSAQTRGFYTPEIHGDNIPPDAVEITDEEYLALIDGQSQGLRIIADESGAPVLAQPSPPSNERVIELIGDAVQAHLDAAAVAAGYDNIFSAVTYADEPAVPQFQAEGQALRAWRSLVWAQCYTLLGEWQAGLRAAMTPEEVIAELPALVMPA